MSSHQLKELARIDEICDRFEDQWRIGKRPSIDDFLDSSIENQDELFRQLLSIEIDYRRQSDGPISFGEYRSEFPRFANAIDALRIQEQIRRSEAETYGLTGATPSAESAPRNRLDTEFVRQIDFEADRYEIYERIGDGGFGSVFRGRDTALCRDVAIKINNRKRASQSVLSEARKLAAISDPGIVQVYDVSPHDSEVAFIVMELIEGQTLREKLHDGPLPVEQAVAIVKLLAESLKRLHKRGIFHRDIKPANILIDKENRPRITDFGLAMSEDTQVNHKGETAGSWFYASPEQIKGLAHDHDGRVDLWSLGVVFYRCLTGKLPFKGDSISAACHQILHKSPVPPRQANPAVPEDIQKICLDLLRKDPDQRIKSASDLLDRLNSGAEASELKKPRSANWGRAFLAASALLAGCWAVVYFGLPNSSSSQPTATSDGSPIVAVPTNAEQPKIIGPTESRNAHKSGGSCVRLSPDGKLVVTAGLRGVTRVWERSLLRVVTHFRSNVSLTSCANFIDNGKTLVHSGHDPHLAAHQAGSGEPIAGAFADDPHHAMVTWVSQHSELPLLASASHDGTAKLWDRDTLTCLWTSQKAGDRSSCAFSPDGEHFAVSTNQGVVDIYRCVAPYGKTKSYTVCAGSLCRLIYLDESTQVVNRCDGSLSVIDLDADNVVQIVTAGEKATDIAFASSSQQLFVAFSSGVVEAYRWPISPGDQPNRRFVGPKDRVNSITIDENRDELFGSSTDGNLYVWRTK